MQQTPWHEALSTSTRLGYPRVVTLADGEVRLSLMGSDDRGALLAFTRGGLPAGAPRSDPGGPADESGADESEVDAWLEEVARGHAVTILACREGAVVGHGSLRRPCNGFPERSGEVSLFVSPTIVRRGLGRALAGAIEEIASQLDLRLLTTVVRTDRTADQAAWSALGFRRQATLWTEQPIGTPQHLMVVTKCLPGRYQEAGVGAGVARWVSSALAVSAGSGGETPAVA